MNLCAVKDAIGIGLAIGGIGTYLFPEFNGVFSGPIKTSTEHRELLGLLSFIGGVGIYFMKTDKCGSEN